MLPAEQHEHTSIAAPTVSVNAVLANRGNHVFHRGSARAYNPRGCQAVTRDQFPQPIWPTVNDGRTYRHDCCAAASRSLGDIGLSRGSLDIDRFISKTQSARRVVRSVSGRKPRPEGSFEPPNER